MRASRVRRKLADGQPVMITKMNTADPVICDIIGLMGFDCLWICQEHIGLDWEQLGNLIRTAAMHDMDVMVRVAKGSYSDLIRPLEMGAAGLMVPHCGSADEARQIAQMTRFHPIGRRAFDSGNADGAYCLLSPAEYVKHANDNTFVVVQIEDPEAIPQIDEIASVAGIDGLFVGPADLVHSLGAPGQFDHPEIAHAVKDTAAACAKHGKAWGMPVSAEAAVNVMEQGGKLLASGADVLGLTAYFRNVRKQFEVLGVQFTPKVS
ncbi:MAG: aldolase [Bryobacterales bacterium]|nr:aldolase [Bryobacterales bacterium]